jgi:hypothetical protein
MRATSLLLTLALLAATPATARQNDNYYEFKGKRYATYEQCVAAKKRSQKRATVAGAAAAGVGAALLGGGVGESLLIAGGGALVGNELGKSSKRKC